MEVAAGPQGSQVDRSGRDPVGPPADVISMSGYKGENATQKLDVDPGSHELLGRSGTNPSPGGMVESDFIVEGAGICSAVGDQPKVTSIPAPSHPLPSDLTSLAAQG